MFRMSFIWLYLLPCWPLSALSKSMSCFHRAGLETSLSVSAGKQLLASSCSVIQFWSMGNQHHAWRVGIGGHYTMANNRPQLVYTTASAFLLTDRVGPAALFTSKNGRNMDTLHIPASGIHMLNFLVSIQHDWSTHWGTEACIDLAGISFGSTRQAVLTYGEKSNATRPTDAKPATGNVLLGGINDRGSLHARLNLTYRWNKQIQFKAGASFLETEYTIIRPVLYTTSGGSVVDADRFRNRSLLLGVGISYHFIKAKNS